MSGGGRGGGVTCCRRWRAAAASFSRTGPSRRSLRCRNCARGPTLGPPFGGLRGSGTCSWRSEWARAAPPAPPRTRGSRAALWRGRGPRCARGGGVGPFESPSVCVRYVCHMPATRRRKGRGWRGGTKGPATRPRARDERRGAVSATDFSDATNSDRWDVWRVGEDRRGFGCR